MGKYYSNKKEFNKIIIIKHERSTLLDTKDFRLKFSYVIVRIVPRHTNKCLYLVAYPLKGHLDKIKMMNRLPVPTRRFS